MVDRPKVMKQNNKFRKKEATNYDQSFSISTGRQIVVITKNTFEIL